ncbi:NAD-dependent epimerase/dehydratase family protein [Haloactinomyces albus]|uniref:Nucleoside-diphosphate-sugar epimerase n=1 Tax=Haloactinomyces albus TaxID=1352928 RepID=A0AAE3ZH80_9ACTN|nr:NAD-dependent epimerase/dehydratase family protein [Haloactinomyces albus]MDR7303871.1 nucleoside-diphosphate-sugar epimerase [Haloactinomyces albus]
MSKLRRAVVTGAAGFIGGHLVKRLVDAGVLVIGVDRRDPKHDTLAAANLTEALQSPNFVFVPADLVDCSVESLLLDADVVFHLAGIPGVRPSWGERFSEYAECNIVVTQRIMEAAVRLGVPRVVVASSSSVYGRTGGAPSAETAATAPMSPYGVSKLAAESLCLAHADRADSRTSVAALRYFTVYGPRQRADMLIGRVLEAALGGPPVRVYGAGGQRRDFTFITDAVEATIAAATATDDTGVFNIGAGQASSVTDVVRIAEELTGTRIPTSPVAARDGDVPATLADHSRAREVLGWGPQVDLAGGMRRHWQWLTADKSPVSEASAS